MTQSQFAHLQVVLPLVNSGTMPVSLAAQMLGLSPRQLRRYLDGQTRVPRIAWNQIPENIQEYVKSLKQENSEYNCQWIAELVSDHFESSISRSSVWRILRTAGLLKSPSITPVVRSRFEARTSGDVVQMDTSWGYWLHGERLNLILLLDDCSRYILAAEFFWQDSAYNNMLMIREVVQDYGKFRLLYTDNASFFKPIRYNQSFYQTHRQAEYESEITRACRELGIAHITHKPYQPQGKGKIERLFRFLQERLVSQFEKHQVKDLEDANVLLWDWVDWYNEEHVNRTTGQTPKKRFDPQGFTPLSGEVSLDDVFCFKDTRKVDKCNQFSYEGKSYVIPANHCLVACKVQLHIHPDRRIRVWHAGKFVCELPFQN